MSIVSEIEMYRVSIPLLKVRVTTESVVVPSLLLIESVNPSCGTCGSEKELCCFLNVQLVLFPPSVILFPAVTIAVPLVLFESDTVMNEIDLVSCGLILHCVPVTEEASVRMFPEVPVRVSVLPMVCVVPEVNVRVSALVTTFERLLKVVEPEMVCDVPSNTIVPEL